MAIVKRKSKKKGTTFQVKVRDGQGNWFPAPTFTDLSDAKTYEAELSRKKSIGGKVSIQDAKRTTLSDYWDVWSVQNRTEISPGWKMSQDQMWRAYIKPVIGEHKLLTIGIPEIGMVMNGVAKLGRAPATRLHVYNLLSSMFGDAVTYYRMLYENPVKKEHHRPVQKETVAEFLDPADTFKLLEHVRDHRFGSAFYIMLLTGLRIGETLAITWGAIDFKLGHIVIRQAWNKKVRVMEEYTKNGTQARVTMPPMLKEYLLSKRGEARDTDFVITGVGGTMASYEAVSRAVKRQCAEAGVKNLTPHEFRHSATEVYVEHGATQQDIKRLLNHKSEKSSAKYIHRTDGRLNGIASSIKAPTPQPPKPAAGAKQSALRVLSGGKNAVKKAGNS